MKKFAFTLSEVIITLSIIGIVVAIVIPNIYSGYKKRILVTQLKSAYSQISAAVDFALVEHGRENWGRGWFKNYIAPNLKIQKDCTGQDKCFPIQSYSATIPSQTATKGFCLCNRSARLDNKDCYYTKLILNNGITISVRDGGNIKNPDNIGLYIDVNGSKGPNKYNYDLFEFYITKEDGLVPVSGNNGAGCQSYTQRVLTTSKIDY